MTCVRKARTTFPFPRPGPSRNESLFERVTRSLLYFDSGPLFVAVVGGTAGGWVGCCCCCWLPLAWLLSACLGSCALSLVVLAKRGRLAMEQRAGGFAYHGRWFMGPYAAYERRAGPVEHTACRPGGKGCHKRFSHIGAKKLAQYFLSEGECAPRGKQSVSALPNPWDDYMLAYERGWKARGKLGKAWAKPGARAPKSDRIAMAAWLVGLALDDDESPADDVD